MGQLLRRLPRNQPPNDNYVALNYQTNASISYSIATQSRLARKSSRSYNKLQKQMQINEKRQKQQLQWYQKVFFTPESTFIMIFKITTLMLIYLYFLEIPITIAFENHRKEDQSQKLFQYINIPAIIIFVLGVFIKLKTAFYKEGILISDQKQVIINYILYMLVFDFLSITSIIIYELTQILRENKQQNGPIAYRFIVILFYLKIPQLLSIQQSIIASFDLKRRVKAFLKLLLLQIKIFMLCNIAACCFFYISDTTCPMENQKCPDCCWINKVEIMGGPLKEGEWSLQYMFSLYWASTTMLTIGYGDITPQNFYQVIYTVTAQFISCITFAFSVNEVWSIIQQRNAKMNKINSRMNVINVYMRDKNVDSDLKSRVNAYLYHFYHTKNLREKQLQSEIVSELTPSLRKQLYFESYGFIFKKHHFFTNFSEQFLGQASQNIRQVGFFEQQIVYEPFTQQNISLYYIFKGQLQSFVQLGNSKTQNIGLDYYEKGSVAGLFEFIRQLNYCHSLMAKKYSLLYVLDYDNWVKAICEYQQDCQNYYMIKHRAQYENKFKKLDLHCKICESNKHQSDLCLHEQIQQSMSSFLSRYLKQAYRMPYSRKNFKFNQLITTTTNTNFNQIRTNHYLHQVQSPLRNKRLRKVSLMISKKQIARPQTLKRLIVQKKTHNEKMFKIILKKKLKEQLSQITQSEQMMNLTLMQIQAVQNYEFYFPYMNATAADWNKQKRRMTFNRMLLKP